MSGSPSARRIAVLLLMLLFTVVLRSSTAVEYRAGVYGDGAFYADMAQAFFFWDEPQIEYTTIHSRRILAPALVAALMRLMELVSPLGPVEPIVVSYAGEYGPDWYPSAAPVYDRLLFCWQVLDTLAYGLIGLIAAEIVSRLAPAASIGRSIGLIAVLAATPTLGRLYVAWPFLNDLPGLAIGSMALLAALSGRALTSGFLLGIAALGRENLLVVYPVFLWVMLTHSCETKRKIALHGVLAIVPYSLVCMFPPFRNTAPMFDISTGLQGAAAGAVYDYGALVLHHVDLVRSDDLWHLKKIATHWTAAGPLLLLTLRGYRWERDQIAKDGLLWLTLCLTAAAGFLVDRYVIYGLFPMMLLARHALREQGGALLWTGLIVLHLLSVRLLWPVSFGHLLQVETMPPLELVWSATCATLALCLIVGDMVVRRATSAHTAVDSE